MRYFFFMLALTACGTQKGSQSGEGSKVVSIEGWNFQYPIDGDVSFEKIENNRFVVKPYLSPTSHLEVQLTTARDLDNVFGEAMFAGFWHVSESVQIGEYRLVDVGIPKYEEWFKDKNNQQAARIGIISGEGLSPSEKERADKIFESVRYTR